MIKRKFHIGFVYEVSDITPKNPKDRVLQLQNELKPFVKVKDDKVYIVVKK